MEGGGVRRGGKKRPEGRRRRHPPPPGAREEFRCSLDLQTAWKRTLTPLTNFNSSAQQEEQTEKFGLESPFPGTSCLTFGLGTKEREEGPEKRLRS